MKSLDHFYDDKRYVSGKSSYCKSCSNNISNNCHTRKRSRVKNLIKIGEQNINKIIKRYGY
jgi:hypothetical protein